MVDFLFVLFGYIYIIAKNISFVNSPAPELSQRSHEPWVISITTLTFRGDLWLDNAWKTEK